ncbi:hypothetical protein [Bradyrhizobium sp. G127]|jgi:hypothetical protein|uniref:hypothetical protein n=1 Tax=Bradyrhizobium sp. G127 TaxID=2904800 RepID=UPI001F187872|nr:hypothetical protein [Bradyrhizobium sp. G127]MCF2522333.1 hypothetical protein [Bradyrhizobium sp. G127]
MTVFQGSSFSPDIIAAMTQAFEEAVDTLPFPVGSARVQSLAKNIVELAAQGERDPERMKLLALLALKSVRHD